MTRRALLLLVAAACSKPAPPTPDAARPRPVVDAAAKAAAVAVDPRVQAARAAATRIGDAICACDDGVCARRPLSDHLMWEGELLLRDDTEAGRALIAAVKADPEVKAQQRRIAECTRRIRAAPPATAQAARAWLLAVAHRDAAALVAASTEKLWVKGWDCPGDRAPAVAACVVKEAGLAKDLVDEIDPTHELTVEGIAGRSGLDLPGWARGAGLEELGATHELVSVSFRGESVYHDLLLAVTRDGKVAAAMWQTEAPE